MLFLYSKSHFPVEFVWMWPYLCFRRSSEMRSVFLRYSFSCESPHPSNTWFFYPRWTAIGHVVYPIQRGAGKGWCPPSQADLDVMWPSSRAVHPQPHCHPCSVSRGEWRLYVPEQSGTLSHWTRGDPVCPSGQTGCCVKQERPISAGISPSAPAGLCGRAGYQHQWKWLLAAPVAPLAPLEPCLNSGSGERFRTWFRVGLGARGQCQQQIPRHCSSPALAEGLQNLQPHVLSMPRPASCGRNFSCGIISQRKCLSMN